MIPRRRDLAALCALLLLSLVGASAQETAEDLEYLDELALDFRRGGTYAAQRELREYLLDVPDSVRARQLAAEVAAGRGRIEEALEHLAAGGDPDPVLRGRLLSRLGRHEEVLALADDPRLTTLQSARLRVLALDALGRRRDALRTARDARRLVDDRALDGQGLLDLGWLLFVQRKFELANQALVFADRELNGLVGPDYELVEPEALILLGRVYEAARQTGQGGSDKTLETLGTVLAVDSGQPDALVVKARAFTYGMNARGAEAALDQALSRDPGHPEALLLRARTRLLGRNRAEALELAEQVLAVDPRQREALALRAVVLHLGRDPEAAEEARATFERLHPESSALQLLLGEVLQSHYRFADSIEPLERALAIEPDDESPLPVLAQSLAHLGRYEDARAALDEHAARSPFVYPWRTNMLQLIERLGDKLRVETDDGFRFLLPPGERALFGELLAEHLATTRADMAARWEFDPDETVVVEVYDVHGDFSVRTVGFEGFLAFGVCFGNLMTMLSPLSEMRGQYQWAQTALHEYAHVVTLGLSRNRLPRWVSEGVSVWEEKRIHPSWARELERDVLEARANHTVPSVARMDEAFLDGSTVLLGYYLGSLVCEVLERDFGFEGLRAFVAAFAEDRTTAEALDHAVGLSVAELDARLLAHIDEVVAPRAAIRPRYTSRGKDALRDLVRAGDREAQAQLAWAYHDLGQSVDRDAQLERALELLGETPSLRRLLAERDLQAGRQDSARVRLLAWVDEGRELEADGLVLLAQLQRLAGDVDAAQESLLQAVALYPGDLSPQGAPAQLIESLDPRADAELRLELLEGLVQHDEASVDARRALADRDRQAGEREAARRWLEQAVQIEPYAAELRMTLAELLVELDEPELARQEWRRVLAIRPEQLPSAGRLGPGGGPVLEQQLDALQATARERLEADPEGAAAVLAPDAEDG